MNENRVIDAAIFNGQSDKAIAQSLGLEEKEIEKWRMALYRELNATTLKQALEAADLRGMIVWQIPPHVVSE
ncbi:MAG: hypothetical protein HZB70_00600 [Candidatus Berkelbacteria bacterium]|nr:MAG: hypothetical protein HZB70_00600 [Candidatus Berkelbacteria bacterium]QQG51393.1 MAG: hypothetical protein HY845_02400 [Candidatus Berkelbacteria bacterium]